MDITIGAGYSNRPYDLRLHVYTIENNVGGNYSRYHWDLYAVSRQGYGSFDNTCVGWEVWVAGQYWSGCAGLAFASGGDYAGKSIYIASGDTSGVGHDGNGYLNFPVRARHGSNFIYGNADTGDQWQSADRIPRVPTKAGAPTASAIQPTSVTLSWGIPDNRGAGIDQMLLRYSTDSSMATYTDVPLGGDVTSKTVSGLLPGTTYYWWVYAHNGVGYSERSDTTTQGTLPASAPGISIQSAISGQTAVVKLSPPGGSSGVTKYLLEWREVGGADPGLWNSGYAACSAEDSTNCYWDANVRGSGVGDSYINDGTRIVYANRASFTGTSYTVRRLTPGKTYEYRAVAYFGSYVSPSTGFISAIQPNPNTSPGDYYDGATTGRPDLTFAWLGTANASRATATGRVPVGWRTFAAAAGTSGATGAVHQATGGFSGTYCARAVFFTDATAAGFIFGNNFVGASEVLAGVTYFGMIHVQLPSRAQRLQAGIAWYASDGSVLSYSWGVAQAVQTSASGWVEMTVSSVVAPAGATKGAAVVRDVVGTSWSLWLGGQELRADATLVGLLPVAYFDGGTPDTPTVRYDWVGAVNASPSTRTQISDGSVDPLLDPDATVLPSPPLPPIIGTDGVETINLWRTFVVQVPASSLYSWRAVIPTVIIKTGSSAERQVRVRYIPNPDGLAVDRIDFTAWDAEQVIAFIPPNTEMTLDGITRRASAVVGDGASRPANHLLSGTDGGPASWPELRCGIPYAISFDVPTDATEGNVSPRVFLTARM